MPHNPRTGTGDSHYRDPRREEFTLCGFPVKNIHLFNPQDEAHATCRSCKLTNEKMFPKTSKQYLLQTRPMRTEGLNRKSLFGIHFIEATDPEDAKAQVLKLIRELVDVRLDELIQVATQDDLIFKPAATTGVVMEE